MSADATYTWADIEWERRQAAATLDSLRDLHQRDLEHRDAIDASYTTVGERVMRAAMERRKVVRIDELLECVRRVIV